MIEAIKEDIWLKQLLEELGFYQKIVDIMRDN